MIFTCVCVSDNDQAAMKAESDNVDAAVRDIIALAQELLPKVEDIDNEAVGDMVDEELKQTTKAIEDAEAKIVVSKS